MKTKVKYLLLVFVALNFSFAQEKDQVLLKVDGQPIMSSEFLRVYNKNLDLVKDESQKDIDGYLKLFTEYQLKLKEAKRLKLDEDTKYQREFLKYKKQLTKNYISENKVTETLVKEAYDRSQFDINASHILVRLGENVKDTLVTYNEVLALKARVLKEGFDAVKADVHDGNTIFLEDLGYFSAFKMVYNFEKAAYKTPVGEISEPFRTQFGYHVVKINDKRVSRGTTTAAHIMVGFNQTDSLLNPEERINEIYKKLKQGESFESLAKQFSDDKSSAKNGGKLAPFKSGQLSSAEFEDQVFALTKNDEVSTPFKTDFGWHIVKRIDQSPIKSFEELKPSLEAKVKRDSRSKLINRAMVKELKSRYQTSYNPNAKGDFESLLDETFFSRSWRLPEKFDKEKTVFSINGRSFSYGEFGRHLTAAQRIYSKKNISYKDVIEKEYNSFFEKSILQYREDNLESENKEFANILKEYRDGLLLFDLMEKEVWNKASKDSVGLEAYYNKNKSNYKWDNRVDVVMASSANKNTIEKVSKLMKRNTSEEDINKAFNTDTAQNVIFTKGRFNADDPKLPSNLEIKEGISKIYKHNEAFHVINIKTVLPAGVKSLKEAKGNVINDYQSQLEMDWIEELHNRFNVEVNQKTLKAIKTKIKKH